MKKFLFILIGGMVLIMAASFGLPFLMSGSSGSGAVGIVAFIALTLAVVFFGIRAAGRMLKPKDIPNGIPATATVVACRQGSMTMKMGVHQYYQLLIDVNITGSNGTTWPAQIKQFLPITQVGLFQPGVSFAVKYDPLDPERVVFAGNGPTANAGQQVAGGFHQAAVNIPGQGMVDGSVVTAAKQAAPTDITLRLQASSVLLNELMNAGMPAPAEVLRQQIYHENYLPGTDAVSIRYRYHANGSGPMESEQLVLTPKASLHKTAVGSTIHVRYDRNDPRRVAMSGTDKQDSAVSI